MKTLINKHNPSIRITSPEIEEDKTCYYVAELAIGKYNWTLVENESPADQVQDMIDTSDLTNEQKVNLLQDLSGYYMKKAHYETK